jgi:hypothetical protein
MPVLVNPINEDLRFKGTDRGKYIYRWEPGLLKVFMFYPVSLPVHGTTKLEFPGLLIFV